MKMLKYYSPTFTVERKMTEDLKHSKNKSETSRTVQAKIFMFEVFQNFALFLFYEIFLTQTKKSEKNVAWNVVNCMIAFYT